MAMLVYRRVGYIGVIKSPSYIQYQPWTSQQVVYSPFEGQLGRWSMPGTRPLLTLQGTNGFAPENRVSQKETYIKKPSIFRCELSQFS